jgi:hypothetical protein
LEDELKYLKSYTALENLRFNKAIKIKIPDSKIVGKTKIFSFFEVFIYSMRKLETKDPKRNEII